MTLTDRFTVRQIVHRIGRKKICKILTVGEASPRKWYDTGIPARHWSRLVKAVDWITYEILEDATAIALKRFKRAA